MSATPSSVRSRRSTTGSGRSASTRRTRRPPRSSSASASRCARRGSSRTGWPRRMATRSRSAARSSGRSRGRSGCSRCRPCQGLSAGQGRPPARPRPGRASTASSTPSGCRALPEAEALDPARGTPRRRAMDRLGDPDPRLRRRRCRADGRRDQPDRGRRRSTACPSRPTTRPGRAIADVWRPYRMWATVLLHMAWRAIAGRRTPELPADGRARQPADVASRSASVAGRRPAGRATTVVLRRARACAAGSTAGSPRPARRRR